MLAIRLCGQDSHHGSSVESHDQDFSFSQIDLQQACMKYFYNTGLMRESNNNDRPRKRARLSIPDRAQPDATILPDLMSNMIRLLGCGDVTNLTDLSEVVA